MTQPDPQPTSDGEPVEKDTIEEPCVSCGVVQEMQLLEQRFVDHPPSTFVNGECPVCGNDHSRNPPV